MKRKKASPTAPSSALSSPSTLSRSSHFQSNAYSYQYSSYQHQGITTPEVQLTTTQTQAHKKVLSQRRPSGTIASVRAGHTLRPPSTSSTSGPTPVHSTPKTPLLVQRIVQPYNSKSPDNTKANFSSLFPGTDKTVSSNACTVRTITPVPSIHISNSSPSSLYHHSCNEYKNGSCTFPTNSPKYQNSFLFRTQLQSFINFFATTTLFQSKSKANRKLVDKKNDYLEYEFVPFGTVETVRTGVPVPSSSSFEAFQKTTTDDSTSKQNNNSNNNNLITMEHQFLEKELSQSTVCSSRRVQSLSASSNNSKTTSATYCNSSSSTMNIDMDANANSTSDGNSPIHHQQHHHHHEQQQQYDHQQQHHQHNSHHYQTSSQQKKFLKSIRLYALGVCAVAFCSSAIVCALGKTSSSSSVPISASTSTYEEQPRVMFQSNDESSRSRKAGSGTISANANDSNYNTHINKHTNKNNSNTSNNSNNSNNIPKVKKPQNNINKHDETLITKLRNEFHEWTKDHGREYGSTEEKEKRFHIWKDNHFRTIEKNEKHGPCKLTGKAVFGSNHFKDLTKEEFRSKYLTGYTGPKSDEMDDKKRRKLRTSDKVSDNKVIYEHPAPKNKAKPNDILSSTGLHDPNKLSDKISRHEIVQERYLKHVAQTPPLGKTYYSKSEKAVEKACVCGTPYDDSSSRRLRKLSLFRRESPMFGKTYYNKSEKMQICGSSYGKTYYNKNYAGGSSSSSSTSLDCSKYKLEADFDYDAISNQRSSSYSCAWYDVSCWMQRIFTPVYAGVGAVKESIYSNYNYPSSIDWRKIGAVTSVHSQGSCGACWAITATETIEAANYISTGTLLDLAETEIIICEDSCQMCNGGWPQNAYDYVEENGGLPAETTSSYDGNFLMTLTSVTSGESDEMTENEVEYIKSSMCPADGGSGDNSGSSTARYGAIKAYAYATDRCVCYTDGSGCDCEEQNEALAVMNVASYGPATVCLEASTWQDYAGGIITTDSGCTSAFLDMNHCVQVVGYAYTDVDDSDGEDEDEGGSASGSNDNSNNSHREGYWIVRNQWSAYWGMSGYAYVAMGANTCGILNDMTQVFMD